jgi:hypothetical protein
MTYLQVDRPEAAPADWRAASMAPASLSPGTLLRDYSHELSRFRSSGLPLSLRVGFSVLWFLQRVAYWWGWRAVVPP